MIMGGAPKRSASLKPSDVDAARQVCKPCCDLHSKSTVVSTRKIPESPLQPVYYKHSRTLSSPMSDSASAIFSNGTGSSFTDSVLSWRTSSSLDGGSHDDVASITYYQGSPCCIPLDNLDLEKYYQKQKATKYSANVGFEHVLSSADTLQGLSIRYSVSEHEIRRLNRLYASDSIHLRKVLFIPNPANSLEPGLATPISHKAFFMK